MQRMWRKWCGIAVAGALCNATFMPTLLIAETAHAAAKEKLRATQQQVWILNKKGETVQHIAGADLAIPISAGVRAFGSQSSDEIEKTAARIRQFQKTHPQHAEIGSGILQVMDILKAPNKSAAHALAKKLSVVTRAMESRDANGRLGTRKEYVVKGIVRVVTFVANSEGASDASPASHGPSVYTDCYDDPSTSTGPGDCATQQEIDDAYSEIAVLDADVEDASDAVAVATEDYCHQIIPDQDYCGLGPSEVESSGGAEEARFALLTHSTVTEQFASPTEISESVVVRADYQMVQRDNTSSSLSCSSQGFGFGASVLGFVGARVAVIIAISVGVLTGWGVVAAIIGLTASSMSLVGSSISLLECLHM